MPTSTVTGTSAIDDGYFDTSSTFRNLGAHTAWNAGRYSAGLTRHLARVNSGNFPGGTITGFRFKFYRFGNANSTQAGVLQAHVVANANTWIEGTGLPADPWITNAPCWLYRQYNVVSWAGSSGLGTDGTDYDTDASPPTWAFSAYTSGGDVLQTMTLDESWVAPWRDGGHTNNGMRFSVTDEATTGKFLACRTSEHANACYFEIDYAAGAFFFQHYVAARAH